MTIENLALYSPETYEITTTDGNVSVPKRLHESLSHLTTDRRLSCLRMWAQRMGVIGSETYVAEVVLDE
mgnify:CR=1 FL=1